MLVVKVDIGSNFVSMHHRDRWRSPSEEILVKGIRGAVRPCHYSADTKWIFVYA